VRDQHLEIEVTFLATSQGGRSSHVKTGYRPQFHYAGRDWDSELTFEVEQVNPGDTAKALVSLMSPEAHRGVLKEGMAFELWEGPRAIATGRVTRILHL